MLKLNKNKKTNYPFSLFFSLFFMVILLISTFASGKSLDYSIYTLDDFSELNKLIDTNEAILQTNPNDVTALKTLGIAYHNLAVIGQKGQAEKAQTYLTQASKIDSKDYEILVFLGSAYTLMGRDSANPFSRISQVNKGCKMIDQAISADPDNIVVRMTRASNSLDLPTFFNRLDYAKSDMLYLLELSQKSPSAYPPDLKAKIYFTVGEYYKVKGKKYWKDAREYWEKAVKAAPESKDGLSAQTRLEVYKP